MAKMYQILYLKHLPNTQVLSLIYTKSTSQILNTKILNFEEKKHAQTKKQQQKNTTLSLMVICNFNHLFVFITTCAC